MPDDVMPRDVWGFDPYGKPKEWPMRFSVAPWHVALKGLATLVYVRINRDLNLSAAVDDLACHASLPWGLGRFEKDCGPRRFCPCSRHRSATASRHGDCSLRRLMIRSHLLFCPDPADGSD